MNSKIKKIMLLTTGLAGGLLATSIAGITLSSCTFQVQQDPNNNNNDNNNNQGNSGSTNQGTTTSPKDELTYNPNANYYTTQIIFDKDGNITNASANTLTIKDGLIFADPAMTTLIGIMPSMQQSTITIPASVKAITGYQAAVVYEKDTGNIVNPDFNPGTGITLATNQTLLDLGAVGAFQHVGAIANGSVTVVRDVTPPKMAPATGLSTLTTIQFENNSQLQTIGPKAFAGCNNLTTVNLPNSTNTIGTLAFQNCTNLQTINLKGVSYIGDAAFNNAFIAQNDALAQANPVVLDLTSAQYIGTGAFDSSKWIKTTTGTQTTTEQVLPGTVGEPGTNTITEVQNLSKISAVSFSKPLTTLSPYAFNGANYLASVDLSSCTSLASVSQNAFSGTQNLTSVKFSNTIDTIGNNAFSGVNAKLTTLTLPANLATVGNNAFNGCSKLSTLTVDSTSLSIGTSAFSGCDLSALDFSKAVGGLIIGTSAFSNNENLKTLKLATENLEPDSQTQIKSQAFSGCKNLDLQPASQAPDGTTNPTTTPIALPSNLTLLAQDAFSGTKSPTFSTTYTGSVQLDSNEWIANDPFGGRWNINQDGTPNTGSSNNTETLGPQLFANNQSITSVDLTGSNIKALGWTKTSSIANSLGSAATDTGFVIPTGNNPANKTLTLGTFANCTNLTTLTLPASCNQFGASKDNYYWGGPFANCQSLANINYNGFDLTPTSDTVAAGFAQMNQATWTQVANIMNAFGYAGQQTIGLATDGNAKITVDPSAANGTWTGSGGLSAKGQSNGPKVWQSGMNGLFTTDTSDNSWVNQPINAYPAGNYEYTTAPAEQEDAARATASPVEVSYAAGLGYSINANKIGTLEAVQNNTSYLQVQGSNLNDNTAIQVPTSTQAASGETITISGTRPMSVWYTVGTSAPDNPDNNIYIPTENKLVGQMTNSGSNYGTNQGDGGIGWTSTAFVENVKKIDGSNSNAGIPFKLQGYSSSAGPDSPNTQNFYALPLGITADTTVAYFNHNGVIWKYEKKTDGSITITGTVNYYVAGSIQDQNNGRLPDTLGSQTFNNNGTGLTSVGAIANGSANGGPDNTGFYGLNGKDKYSYNGATAALLLFSQKGQDTSGNEATIGTSVGPKGLTVTLTLVPVSEQSAPTSK